MSSVYSTLFITVAAADVNARYVVPDGYRAVVKDIGIFFNGAPANTSAFVTGETGGGFIFYRLALDPYEFNHWVGSQVVNEGSTITLASGGPQVVYGRVSGYLLTLP